MKKLLLFIIVLMLMTAGCNSDAETNSNINASDFISNSITYSNTTNSDSINSGITKSNIITSNVEKNDFSDANISQNAKYLNLDTSFPTVTGIYYAAGVYLITTESNEIYISKDLKVWKKTKRKISDSFYIVIDPPRGFLLVDKNKYYVSDDGENWEHIEGMENFFTETINYSYDTISITAFYKNNIIVAGAEKNATKKFGKYTAVYTKETNQINNDGDVLFGIDIVDGYQNRLALYSFDGINWKKADIYGTNYTSFIKCLPVYDNKKILEIYSSGCGSSVGYYSYKIKNQNVEFEHEQFLKYFKQDLTPQKIFFNLIITVTDAPDVNDNYYSGSEKLNYLEPYLDKGFNQAVFEAGGFQADFLVVQDYIGYINLIKSEHEYGSDYTVPTTTVQNGKFYYYGKYGGIIEIDKDFNMRWVGLYPRKSLNRVEMADPLIGGKIGIIEKNGVLAYYNKELSGDSGICKIYVSTDGINWKYQSK